MIGETVLHYRIVEKLGSGGMGDVYRARDTKLNRDVALKVLSAEMAKNPDRRKRFEREAQAVAALKHPNIVTIYSVESASDTHFLTMELVEGQTLSELIPEGGLSLNRFFDLAIPLADAVAGAHAKGITHRDLKPANVMLDHDGRLKVLDFGLAKLFEPVSSSEGATMVKDASATAEGKILGTAAYMSPEQAEGRPIDHRTDIFSLGIILYEMATGERPFKGDTSMSVLGAIMKDTPSSITDIKHRFPRALDRIINHCLAKDPHRRFQSVMDIRNQLETFKAEVDSGEVEGRLTAKARRVNLTKLGIGAGAVALLVAAIILGPRVFKASPVEDTAPLVGANPTVGVIGFENLTDPEDPEHLGRMLAGLITTDLAESRGLKVVTTPRILSALRQAGGGSQSTFDAAVAGEAASLAGAEIMLVGQILQTGDRLILTAELAQVESGNTLGSLKKEAASNADLFALAGGMAEEVRDKLGVRETESASSAVDLAEMLTDSPQAYRHYVLGELALHRQEWEEAVQQFDHSIREDRTFAMAYYRKAVASWWAATGDDALAVLKEGEPYKERLPEHWQLLYQGVTEYFEGREQDAYQTLTRLVETPDALYFLGELCTHARHYQDLAKAMKYFERAIKLDPTFTIVLYHLMEDYILAGDLPAAERAIARCRVESPDDPVLAQSELKVLLARGKFEEVITRGERLKAGGYTAADEVLLKALVSAGERQRAFALAEKMANTRAQERTTLANTQIAFGQIKKGLGTFREYMRIHAGDTGSLMNRADNQFQVSAVSAFLGDFDVAIEEAEAAIAIAPEYFPAYPGLAFALHHVGKESEANEVLARMEALATELESAWGAYWVDLSRAQVHLWRGEIAEAEAALEIAVSHPPIHRDQSEDWFVRGMILDAKEDAAGAATAYAKVWNANVNGFWPHYLYPTLSFYLQSKAEEKAGDPAAAREHYKRFLHSWGETDIPIPEVEDAKSRLKALEAGL